MGRGLVGDGVEALALLRPCRLDLGGVADEGDRQRLAVGGSQARHRERRVRRVRQPVDVADLVAPPGPRLVDLDGDDHAVVHRHRERLGAAHPAQAGRQDDPPPQGPAEVLARQLGERLVRALQDPLGPDVDPGARRHLAVHHQAGLLELAEVLPGGPLPDEVRVGDQHARRPRVRPEDADRLARLDEERLVVGEGAELPDDDVEGLPAPRGATGPAVHDEGVGVLRDLRVEVVHEHPEDRLLLPAAAGDLRAARGTDGAGAGEGRGVVGAGRGRHAQSVARPAGRVQGKSAPTTARRPAVAGRRKRPRRTARCRGWRR